MLKPKKLWSSKTKQELTEEIAGELGKVPGVRLSFSQPIALRVNELISGIKSDVAVKIFGEDMTVLKTAADKIAAKMNRIKGATDVKVEQISGMEQLDIVINREHAARFGLNVADINDAIEIAVKGKVVTTFF
jgi:cobalt-zinc-cadmium resistance protein CzcA